MGISEEPLRRRFCRGAGCGVVFWICRHCDRGHQYCGERCRRKRGGANGGPPTGGTSKVGKDGSITATGNGPTGNAAACGA